MGKPVNQKCQRCVIVFPSFVNKSERPQCWRRVKCRHRRHHYKHLEAERQKGREYHRYLKHRNDRCALCKSKENLNVHHVIPQSAGGEDCKTNLMTLCLTCHKTITAYYSYNGWIGKGKIMLLSGNEQSVNFKDRMAITNGSQM